MEIDANDFLKFLTPIGTLFAGIFLERYKNRTLRLEKSVTVQHIAYTANDENFGEIQILYNGLPSQNLYSVFIEIENNGTRSIKDFTLNISIEDGFAILRNYGHILHRDLTLSIGLTKKCIEKNNFYFEFKDNEVKPDSWNNLLNYVLRQKSFAIPVLNKKAKIQIELLVDGPINLTESKIQVGVFEDNVDIIPKRITESYKKTRQNVVNIIGAAIFVFSPLYVVKLTSDLDLALWLMVLLNFACFALAWILYLSVKWVIDFFR